MQNINVHRYSGELADHWQGFIEPADLSWIMFVDATGQPVVFLHRDPMSGAVLESS